MGLCFSTTRRASTRRPVKRSEARSQLRRSPNLKVPSGVALAWAAVEQCSLRQVAYRAAGATVRSPQPAQRPTRTQRSAPTGFTLASKVQHKIPT